MSDLFERVRDTIAPIAQNINFNDMPDGFYPVVEEIAGAAIAEVRRYDVERGPSDAELTAFADAEIKARRWDYHDARTANRKGMEAAAKVRAEEEAE